MEVSGIIRKHKPFSPTIKIALGYILLISIGAFLLLMPFSAREGVSVGLVDALFTSTSAVCVTGLVVVDTYTTFNFFGQLVVFLLIQFGGLGFMTMASLMMMALRKRISLKDKLSISESFGNDDIKMSTKITKVIFIVTVIIELIGAAAVLPVFLTMEGGAGLAIWRSLFHSVAAFCNAGFDLMGGTGMTPFVDNPLFNIVTISVIFCGGIGASVIMNIIGRVAKKDKITFNTKMIVFASFGLLFGGALYFLIAEYNNPDTIGNLTFGQKVLASLFQSMTTRSAGFNTVDQGALTSGGYLVSDLLMVIGVSPASTGGGIKIATFLVILASLRSCFGGRDDYHMAQKSISKKAFNKAVAIFVFYILAIIVALAVLCISESGVEIHALLFECISALSNVGLTTGITYDLSEVGRIVLILLMYLGRAGFLCVVYSVIGANKLNIKYPDSKIIIG